MLIVEISLLHHNFQRRHAIDPHPDFEWQTVYNSNELHSL